MLQVTDVSFAYSDRGPRVLEHVSVEVLQGELVGLLGPNGSGKTTLLKVMAAILRPKSGSVQLDGHPLTSVGRRDLAKRIAVVPQETHSAFDFTVLDIVMMGRYPHLGMLELEGAQDLEIAREAMTATGTQALETRRFATLSGGEKQRVAIAAALAQASDALLLDEPTASLDLGYQLEISTLLARLNGTRGTTMVVSTHDLNLAAALCTRIVLLKGGCVLAQGRTEEVMTPDNIHALYGVDAEVRFHPRAARLTVVPLGRRN